ncbi:MAG TPA: N-acetylmannosamine kinase [Lachnospiraceae bacterium]|uniref:MurR/RpiR family transcriptional regulator n=1 Tax=Anaerosporobacter sp. TaxID=1872529 RepID=UPI000ED76AEC|nr:MurR/RpiR family transcriptional regulator [Anaerosporobacter sp.]HAB59611.1 N-acetylmannosamine kinase [Lachnospiraceae bacterium]
MNTQTDLVKNINNKYNSLSKGQKLLANYILNNYDKAVYLTAAKMGKIVGVSESTVVRFATILGYDGYPKLQRALEEMAKNKLNSVQRMEVTFDRINKDNILKYVLHSDAEKIRLTAEEIDEKAFKNAIEMLLHAKKIYIIGIRSSAPLASFLSYYLGLIFDHVVMIQSNSTSELFEQLYRIGEEDVLVGISFPRYSRSTLKAMEFASNRKAKLVSITDSYVSPMTKYCDCNLLARCDMASIADSIVAPMSIINAIIVGVCQQKQEEVVSTFASLEEIWNEYQVYRYDEEGNQTNPEV